MEFLTVGVSGMRGARNTALALVDVPSHVLLVGTHADRINSELVTFLS